MGRLLLALLALVSMDLSASVHTLTGHTMGSTWSVTVVLDDSGAEHHGEELANLQQLIQSDLDSVEQQFSTWRANSDLSIYNQSPVDTWQKLPPDSIWLLKHAIYYARLSDGAFDPTIGPLVELWGFGASGHRRDLPTAAEIIAAHAQVGWDRVRINEAESAVWQPGGLHLELSAVAQGHASDRIARLLDERGLQAYLVDITGEMRARGKKTAEQSWQVAIEWPDGDDQQDSIAAVLPLRNMAIATSGNYRNRYRIGSREIVHTIDSRTAQPVSHALISVSVLHKNAVDADALATLLLVMGPDKAREFAQCHRLSVLMILNEEDGMRIERVGQFPSDPRG